MSSQFIHQHPVFRVVDRHSHKMYAASSKCCLERRRQVIATLDSASLGTISSGVCDEVGIPKGHAEIREAVHALLPADHSVGIVLQDQYNEIEVQPYGCPSPHRAITRRSG
jgi:hypothetical protein